MATRAGLRSRACTNTALGAPSDSLVSFRRLTSKSPRRGASAASKMITPTTVAA
jgi:hypothetical protein